MIETIEISGFRGFAEAQSIPFAVPTGKTGSGLTIIVGANNSGKSTIIEALHFLQRSDHVAAFTTSRRNALTRGRVEIRYKNSEGHSALLGTGPGGGGDVKWRQNDLVSERSTLFVVPSRRALTENAFENRGIDRAQYANSVLPGAFRNTPRHYQFPLRMVRMHEHKPEVDAILAQILDEVPEWMIEPLEEDGRFTVKVYTNRGSHHGEGMGEGIVSLLFLADALYDSEAQSTIIIDEPELSLHPSVQRRLARILAEYAATRQIVYATHSPYFAEWEYVVNGAKVVRVTTNESGAAVAALRSETARSVGGFLRNFSNPHIVGLDAREVFFLRDRVILVEGQDDVIGYAMVAEQLNQKIDGEFYGWGVGGADNMKHIAQILLDLDYRHVVGIVDADREDVVPGLRRDFPRFHWLVNPAPDVRAKTARRGVPAKKGLLDSHWRIDPSYLTDAAILLQELDNALRFEPPEIHDSREEEYG